MTTPPIRARFGGWRQEEYIIIGKEKAFHKIGFGGFGDFWNNLLILFPRAKRSMKSIDVIHQPTEKPQREWWPEGAFLCADETPSCRCHIAAGYHRASICISVFRGYYQGHWYAGKPKSRSMSLLQPPPLPDWLDEGRGRGKYVIEFKSVKGMISCPSIKIESAEHGT